MTKVSIKTCIDQSKYYHYYYTKVKGINTRKADLHVKSFIGTSFATLI